MPSTVNVDRLGFPIQLLIQSIAFCEAVWVFDASFIPQRRRESEAKNWNKWEGISVASSYYFISNLEREITDTRVPEIVWYFVSVRNSCIAWPNSWNIDDTLLTERKEFIGRQASMTAYAKQIAKQHVTIGDCTDLSSFSRLPQIVYIAVEMPLLGRR